MANNPRKNAEGYSDPTPFEAMNNREKDTRRRIQGKRSKIAGDYFENVLEHACTFYYDRNLANIEKTPEPMKVIKPIVKQPGHFVACFTKAAQPDYKGTIQSGRSIVFEAKHTDDTRIDRGRLSKEQMDSLEKHYILGALAFVVVSFGLKNFYRIPWIVWRDMKDIYGRKYILEEEIAVYRIPAPGNVVKILEGIVDLKGRSK